MLKAVEGEMDFIGQRVHIRGALPGSARYDPTMSDDQRRSIQNLVLMCKSHHEIVDIRQPTRYPVSVLTRWKAQREAEPREALKRLREVTPSGLRKIVADGLKDHDARLLQALNRLESNDHESAELMRSLLDELTEAYSRLRTGIDPDVVNELHRASRNLLRTMDPDVIYELGSAAQSLTQMQSTIQAFIEVAPLIRRIPPNLGEYL